MHRLTFIRLYVRLSLLLYEYKFFTTCKWRKLHDFHVSSQKMTEIDLPNRYRFYFATVRGVLGHTSCKPQEQAGFHFDKSGEAAEITCMQWGRNQDEILYGNSAGHVRLYDTLTSEFQQIMQSEGTGSVAGIGIKDRILIAARKSGHITLKHEKVESQFSTISSGSTATVDCMVLNESRGNVIATGGEANDLKLWDIETQKAIFKAKSMGNDELNLPIRTSVKGISFHTAESDKLTSCVTKEGNVLLYDERAQRRPICKFYEAKASYSCIASTYRDRTCLAGTTRGYLQLIDMRAPAKCLKTFKSFTGGVTSIVCDPNLPIVASTSIDRHLRVHNLDTKELLHKEYVKQSLTCILMKAVVKEEQDHETQQLQHKEEDAEILDEEYESLFESMQVVREDGGSLKKKRKINNDSMREKTVKVKKRIK